MENRTNIVVHEVAKYSQYSQFWNEESSAKLEISHSEKKDFANVLINYGEDMEHPKENFSTLNQFAETNRDR